MQFEHLFTPIKIGTKTAKNRIVFPGHGIPVALPFCADETDGERYIAYQAARAKGGCALNVIGPLGCYAPAGRNELTNFSPPTPEILIPKCRNMADALHEHGTLAIMQLFNYGGSYAQPYNQTWGYTRQMGQLESVAEWQAMDEDELNGRVSSFVKYAVICQEGGLDGVEIHACHGDLVQQSWSKWSNQRKDKWGEPMYFATQIVERIRKAVGKDFILSFRIPGDDLSFNGMDNEANSKVARTLEEIGVNLLNVSIGCGGASYAATVGSMYYPPAALSVPLASGIKQAVKYVPVVAVSRINDPALAENAIADGHCDMVGLVRGQLADPEFGNKAREGRIEDIRLCIGCNQGCWDYGIEILRCTQNAVLSKESTRFAAIKPAERKKKVIVVGGGPGGMEAARVAAIRGHNVTLYEKSSELGGQINTLSKAPGREEFNQITRFLVTQINKLSIRILVNTEATSEIIKEAHPDAVIIATGSLPFIVPVPGWDQANVVSPSQVLDGKVTAGDKVIIYDGTGLQEAPTVADFLAGKGKQVEILTHFSSINTHWGLMTHMIGTHIPVIWERLKRKGVTVTPLAMVKSIAGKTVTIADVITGEERVAEDIDTVVMATGYRSNNRLFQELKGQVEELYVIGDCALPRRVLDAINEGYMNAFDI